MSKPSPNELRELADRLSTAFGKEMTGNVHHQLHILAERLEGVPKGLAGFCCVACGGSLRDGRYKRAIDKGVVESVCVVCVAEGRDEPDYESNEPWRP